MTFAGTQWLGRPARADREPSLWWPPGTRSAGSPRSPPRTGRRSRRRRGDIRRRSRHALRHPRDREAAVAAGTARAGRGAIRRLGRRQRARRRPGRRHLVAAGSVALATAIVVKLTRVVLLAPLVAVIAYRQRASRRPVRPGSRRYRLHPALRRRRRGREPRRPAGPSDRPPRPAPERPARARTLRGRRPRQHLPARTDRGASPRLRASLVGLIAAVSYGGVRVAWP